MTLVEAILLAEKTTGRIRMKRWLSPGLCFCYVENGYVRQEHNETQTGKVREFSIEELCSTEWEVVDTYNLDYMAETAETEGMEAARRGDWPRAVFWAKRWLELRYQGYENAKTK
jgi:hypothetical protein